MVVFTIHSIVHLETGHWHIMGHTETEHTGDGTETIGVSGLDTMQDIGTE